jgi:hypothetical protein
MPWVQAARPPGLVSFRFELPFHSPASIMASCTDLYGFELVGLTDAQMSARLQCELSARQQEPAWMEYIEKDRMPSSDSKAKEMIRKASEHRLLVAVGSIQLLQARRPLCDGG